MLASSERRNGLAAMLEAPGAATRSYARERTVAASVAAALRWHGVV